MAESATTRKAQQLAGASGPDLATEHEPVRSVEGSEGLAERVQAGRVRQLVEDNPAARAGRETSEWRGTVVSWIVGAIVFAVGLFAPGVPDDALREILLWIGGLLVGGPTVAYTASRTYLKRKLAELVPGSW